MSTIRILLVEDHRVMRQGLKALFAAEPDLAVVGEAENGRLALRAVAALAPDLVLMDISMPGMNGIEATRQIKEKYPHCQVVVLSMHANEEYVFQVLQAGAAGYVLKQADSAEVITAIRAAMAGQTFLSPEISRTVIDDYARRAEARGEADDLELLTAREREIAQLLAEGLSNQEIGQQLAISVKTVESHRANMMQKLGLSNKAQLVRYVFRRGWASYED